MGRRQAPADLGRSAPHVRPLCGRGYARGIEDSRRRCTGADGQIRQRPRRELLRRPGLNLRCEEDSEPDTKVPAGQILTQDPQPGVLTRRERSVKVWVSAGPRATIVPALLGESERTAQLRLQQDGLELAGMSEIRSAEYPSDAVIAQTPPPTSNARASRFWESRGNAARPTS